jgi:hypothetical protein
LQIVEILCWLALKNHLASTSGRSRASWVPAALPPCDGQPVAAADLANPQATTTPTQHMNVLGERTGVPLGAVRRGRTNTGQAVGRDSACRESNATSLILHARTWQGLKRAEWSWPSLVLLAYGDGRKQYEAGGLPYGGWVMRLHHAARGQTVHRLYLARPASARPASEPHRRHLYPRKSRCQRLPHAVARLIRPQAPSALFPAVFSYILREKYLY